MKRIIPITLLCGLLLAGCGKTDDSSSGTSSAPAEKVTSGETAAETAPAEIVPADWDIPEDILQPDREPFEVEMNGETVTIVPETPAYYMVSSSDALKKKFVTYFDANDNPIKNNLLGSSSESLVYKCDENGKIIYMTSSNAFYKDAFRIHAAHYLEKPILEDEFFDAMDRVCVNENTRFFTVRESGNINRIPLDDIEYVESEDHYKRIVTGNGSFLVRSTMQAIFDDIDCDYFYMLGMNRIINLKKVLKISKEIITMEDGKTFSVPRGTYRTLSELVLNFTF